jgi:hypothetical protein
MDRSLTMLALSYFEEAVLSVNNAYDELSEYLTEEEKQKCLLAFNDFLDFVIRLDDEVMNRITQDCPDLRQVWELHVKEQKEKFPRVYSPHIVCNSKNTMI